MGISPFNCILSKKDGIYKFFYTIPLNLPLKKGDLSPSFSKEGLGGLYYKLLYL